MLKIKMKFGGYIYVEKYHNKHNEEENRSKIFDENFNYIDYISTESITKKDFKNILKSYKTQSIEEFIENFADSYDYCIDIRYLLDSVFENDYIGYDEWEICKDNIDQLQQDYKTLTDIELCEKYYVNVIGKYYIYMGW